MLTEFEKWYKELKQNDFDSKEYNKILCLRYPFLIPRNENEEIPEDFDYFYTMLYETPK